jgi:hypothetical protein
MLFVLYCRYQLYVPCINFVCKLGVSVLARAFVVRVHAFLCSPLYDGCLWD